VDVAERSRTTRAARTARLVVVALHPTVRTGGRGDGARSHRCEVSVRTARSRCQADWEAPIRPLAHGAPPRGASCQPNDPAGGSLSVMRPAQFVGVCGPRSMWHGATARRERRGRSTPLDLRSPLASPCTVRTAVPPGRRAEIAHITHDREVFDGLRPSRQLDSHATTMRCRTYRGVEPSSVVPDEQRD